MPKRLVDYDPVTGIKTYHAYDHDQKQTTIFYEGDVEPALDFNKAIQNSYTSEYRRKRDMWHVAHIPAAVVLKWKTEDGIDVYNPDHLEDVMKKLDDPNWKYLRSITGRLV